MRAHEGEELTRAEAVALIGHMDTYLFTLSYNRLLMHTDFNVSSLEYVEAVTPLIQFYVGSEYGRRRWEVTGAGWPPEVAEVVDAALAAADQRDVLGYFDYIRGATDEY